MPSTITRRPLSGDQPTDTGTLTHLLVGMHAPLLGVQTEWEIRQRILAAAPALVASPNRMTRRRVVSQAAGMSWRYLTRFAPAGWTLLGVEVPLDDGTYVDVAWRSATGLVLFDELKAYTRTPSTMPRRWATKARGYTRGGVEAYGKAFVATRVLPVSAMHLASAFLADGSWLPIQPCPLEPMRRRAAA